uniref:Uncharacterized protein n=1 Tax=Tetranychus urticae TaxID=32264 RepID=T1JZJ4_TETUR
MKTCKHYQSGNKRFFQPSFLFHCTPIGYSLDHCKKEPFVFHHITNDPLSTGICTPMHLQETALGDKDTAI